MTINDSIYYLEFMRYPKHWFWFYSFYESSSPDELNVLDINGFLLNSQSV